MAKFVFAMNQSLDGYIDHTAFDPHDRLFQHFIDQTRKLIGSVYGRRMYEVMRYWDEDDPEWTADFHAYAEAWRRQKKWIVSSTLKSVGPNATLLKEDLETAVRRLKAEQPGNIEVAGPQLAHALTRMGLVDEYQIYLHPVVLGSGKPFFAGPQPPLRLTSSELIVEGVIRLTYVPA